MVDKLGSYKFIWLCATTKTSMDYGMWQPILLRSSRWKPGFYTLNLQVKLHGHHVSTEFCHLIIDFPCPRRCWRKPQPIGHFKINHGIAEKSTKTDISFKDVWKYSFTIKFSILFHYHLKKQNSRFHFFVERFGCWILGLGLLQNFSSQDTCDLHRARAPMGPKLDAITPNARRLWLFI